MMNRKKTLAVSTLVCTLIVLACYVLIQNTGGQNATIEHSLAASGGSEGRFPGENALNQDSGELEDEADITVQQGAFIARLKELYAEGLDHPRVQLEALESLIRYLKKQYPDDWESRVLEYVKAAFPEYADEMYNQFKRLIAYKKWIEDNYAMLTGMTKDRMDELMWEKRKVYFGDDAMKIWGLELKQNEVRNVLEDIRYEKNMPFENKAALYRQQLGSIYGEISEAYIKAHQQAMMNQFLEVESVQSDLADMNGPERQKNLTAFRKSMGLDGEAINRWNHLDAVRDSRWAKGQAYMKEREKLLKKTGGDDREAKLSALRVKYFGNEAATVEKEEQSRFYRFSVPRIYGKN